MQETREFIIIIEKLAQLYPKLPNMAATIAVNFAKERFVMQNWVDRTRQPWVKRKESKYDKRKGRAILVDKAILKRDIHKIEVSATRAVIGTTRLTAGYAKAHNEGFEGTVTVKQHSRRRYKKVKEKYTTKKGNARTRTSKQVDTDKATISVQTHTRKMKIPERRFLGASAVLDRRIERYITNQFIQVLKSV